MSVHMDDDFDFAAELRAQTAALMELNATLRELADRIARQERRAERVASFAARNRR